MAHILNRRGVLAAAALPLFANAGFAAERTYSGQFISMETSEVELLGSGGKKTSRLIFRTSQDAPIIYAKQGEQLSLQVSNRLPEPVWLFFYGIRAGQEEITKLIGPNETREITFVPPDAGTFWFGPLINASRLRESGLQGMLIVDPAVPDTRYVDVPLILDDWLIDDNGKIDDNFNGIERAAGEGRLGNWYTINSKFKPTLKLDKDKPSRLRILNTSNSRTFTLQFKNADALILARDGQPITPFAVPASGLVLAPGQRADIVLAAVSAPQVVLAFDLFEDVVEAGFLAVDGVLPGLPEPPTLPANALPNVDTTNEPRVLLLAIEGGIKGGLKQAAFNGEMLDLRTLLEKGKAWAVNGVVGPSGTTIAQATIGETFIFNVENETVFDQPLALHGHLWHQLGQDGIKTVGGNWRDTAIIPALSSAQFAVVAEREGIWGIQSLIAERSDSGLFGALVISKKP
jgi:FtsP/CotA-like multicopper oxidase with cupredoxin domain